MIPLLPLPKAPSKSDAAAALKPHVDKVLREFAGKPVNIVLVCQIEHAIKDEMKRNDAFAIVRDMRPIVVLIDDRPSVTFCYPDGAELGRPH